MKWMVGIAVIVALVLLALVGVACADVEVKNVDVGENDSKRKEVYCNEDFYYYATVDVSDKARIDFITLTLNVSNQTKTYSAIPITPSLNFTPDVTSEGTYKVKFGPVNFWYFDPPITKARNVQYEVCWKTFVWIIPRYRNDIGPREVLIPPPKVEWQPSPPQNFYYGDVLEAGLFVDDKAPIHGYAYLSARNLSSNETKFDNIIESKIEDCGGNKYIHKWRLEQGKEAKKDYHNFMDGDKGFTFEICAIYNNAYHSDVPPENIRRCANITITEYIPKIVGGPYLNATADAFKFLGKDNKTEIDNIKWKDLDEGNFSFSVTIEDKIEKGSATLQVYKIKNDSITNYSLKSDEGEGFPYEYKYYNESIRFDRNDANTTISLRLNYSRPNLPSEFWNEWPKVYNITMIPFEIDFKNATVEPEEGNWSDEFKYSVFVNASKNLFIALEVFDPCLETWPWRPIEPSEEYFKNGWKTLNWTIKKANHIFSENCSGESKFYFKYEGGKTQVYSGPVLISIPPHPPEFDNGIPNPNVTIYCNWSKSSTPCNYSVNVSTEDEYKVRLLVKDPTGNWIPKGDVKDVSSETKNITWTDITPFESLNMDNITQYIGNVNISNFTFKYNEHTNHKEFEGPLLVAAFRDPKIDREEINYNDIFNYSVNVIGSRNLNVTLKYYNGTKWVNASKIEPTKDYIPSEGEKTLTWSCIANETWEKVMMDVEVEGEKKPIKVY